MKSVIMKTAFVMSCKESSSIIMHHQHENPRGPKVLFRLSQYQESGRETAPPVVQYNVPSRLSNEGYIHSGSATTSANLAEQLRATSSIQSPQYTSNYSSYSQQRHQASPRYTPSYSPCPSPNPNYTVTPKANPIQPSHSPHYTPNYSPSSHLYPSSLSSQTLSSFNSQNNFDLQSTSNSSTKSQHSTYLTHESTIFPSAEHISSTLFNIPKSSKSNSNTLPRYSGNHSNFSYFSNNQPKYGPCKSISSSDCFGDKYQKSKSDLEAPPKLQKSCKDETEFNCNIGDLQQFLSKHGSKIKSDAPQDSVTDSLLNFLHRKSYEKNFHDNYPYESSDINQVLVSICNKNRSDELSELKRKEVGDESKLITDFAPKFFAEKEEKRCKNVDEKRRSRKELFEESDSEQKRTKRDAMSHYQEDKSHKRPPGFGDFNQWDYLNAQDIQTSSNHTRRGIPFCGSSQSHSMAWNPMSMSHQTNPYYTNTHGHVLPAHAHTEYRFNQWNNSNHKNVPNIQNAHSQNTVVAQTKLDVKPQNQNSVQDFELQLNSEYSKLRNSPHDMVLRTPTQDASSRTLHSDYPPVVSSGARNPSTLKTTSPIAGHVKAIISNPLTDLQMLVTNQDADKIPEKLDVYQQESVDLSAHSENIKQKDLIVGEEQSGDSRKDSLPASVIQMKPKQNVCGENEKIEKPVELTAKNGIKSDRSGEKEISSTNDSGKQTLVVNTEAVDRKEEKSHGTPKENQEVKMDNEVPKKNTVEEKKKALDSNDELDKMLARFDDSQSEKDEKILDRLTDLTNPSEVPATSSNDDLKDSKTEGKNEKLGGDKNEPENTKLLIEVESELQKMFENGGEENNDLPTVSSTSVDVKPSGGDPNKKTARKKPSRPNRSARLSSGQSSGSEDHSPKKKLKNFKFKEEVRKRVKCDIDFPRRGPVLHLEGPKDSPSSVIVVNFPKGDDEDEKDKSSVKKQVLNSNRSKHHNELDYRGRSKNRLFSSTLSARYDAQTTDISWICVFCKKGPHYNTLGDLFGPYIISKNENNSLCEFSGDEKDISDAQKRGGRNKKSIRANNMVDHFQKMSKKLRRCHSGEFCLSGMTVVSDDDVDELRYEVWMHEQCAVWSPNVCLIGSRILGMQEAIWSSVKTMCSKCGIMGANIGCVHRNCPNRSHYDCAKESGWSLEQETFISTCHIHKQRS